MKNERRQISTNLWLICLALLGSFGETPAVAANSSQIQLNFLTDRLLFSGHHKAKKKRNSTRSGLDAELHARRKGISQLGEVFKASCDEENINPKWKDSVRSLGSEVYADNTLKILLAGKISAVLNHPRQAADVLHSEGGTVAFRIPQYVPFKNSDCGVLKLDYGGSSPLPVIPSRKKNSNSEKTVVISLIFENSSQLLVPKNKKNRELLAQTNLSEFQDRKTALVIPIKP